MKRSVQRGFLLWIHLAAFAAAGDVAVFRDGVNGYTGTDDTVLDEGYSNRNVGGSLSIIVGDKLGSIHYRKGLLRFDLTSLTDSLGVGESIQINSASLWTRVSGVDVGADTTGGTQTIHLYAVSAVNANWIEGDLNYAVASNGEATWAKKYAATTNWIGSVGLGTAGTDYNAAEAGNIVIDMTQTTIDQIFADTALSASIVQGWVDDASSNGGLLMDMEQADKGHVIFYSSEYSAASAPELTIDYTVVLKPRVYPVESQLDRIWENRKLYLIDQIHQGFSNVSINAYVLYNVQLYTAPLLQFAAAENNISRLDGLADLYLTAVDYLTLQTSYVYYYWPGYAKESIHPLETPARMWISDASKTDNGVLGAESLLVSGQFIYGVAYLINAIVDLPPAQRTANMTNLVAQYVPVILTDHYDRWVFAGQGVFQRKGWGASTGLYNHLEHLSRIYNREYDGTASYMNAVTDTDLWILAGVTEMLAAHAKDPVLIPMTDQAKSNLLDYVELGSELVEDRLSVSALTSFQGQAVSGLNFDLGVCDDHPGHEYSGSTAATPPMDLALDPIPGTNVGWDISHARRWVNVFETLYRNRSVTGLTFPDSSVMEGLSAQLIYGSCNKDLNDPLFSNFMDRQNGWYRVGYHDGFPGYSPYGLCTSFTTGGYGFWSEFNSDIATVSSVLWDKINELYTKDLSGNHRNGFVEYGVWQAVSANGSSGSMTFSGTTDSFLDGVSDPAYASSQGTIEFWLKPELSGRAEDLANLFEDADSNYLLIHRLANQTLYVGIEKGGIGWTSLTTTQTVPTGVWTHLAVAQDGTGVKIYINGVEAATQGGNSSDWTGYFSITDVWFAKGHLAPFEGAMDDVRVYDRALTAAEIVQDMAGQTPAFNNMVSRWEFDVRPSQADIDFVADYYDADYDLSDSLHLLMFLPVLLNDAPPSSGLFFMLK